MIPASAARFVVVLLFAASATAGCAGDGKEDPSAEATPTTARPSTTQVVTTTPRTTLDARSVEACAAWRSVREGVVETADSGREPQRSQLLDALQLLRDSQVVLQIEDVQGGDLESLDYWFDPIFEYVAFGTEPEATADPRYVGDRDAFVMAVGVFDQFCDEGMR